MLFTYQNSYLPKIDHLASQKLRIDLEMLSSNHIFFQVNDAHYNCDGDTIAVSFSGIGHT